jgi:hypothetical protein
LHHALIGSELTKEGYEAFNKKISEYADKPHGALSEREKEKYAVRIFFSKLLSQPRIILLYMLKTFLKYLFVPIESLIWKLTALYASDQVYSTYVRPILALICLPVWLLSLIPPVDSPKKRAYYLMMITFLVYVVGVTAINPLQGERIRFPILAFMLSVMVWNVHRVSRGIHSN